MSPAKQESEDARAWLARIHALPAQDPVRILNVCGGHERTITLAGLRSVLPPHVELIPGPGCPVCVCPEEDIRFAMGLAEESGVIVAAFGDMLRVPVSAPKSQPRSLEKLKALGADVFPISGPREVVQLARRHPAREVVFFAAGFETTMAPVAAMLLEGVPDNLQVLLSGRLTWPAVSMLLEADSPGFDALIAPGHVATVMGPEQWQFLPDVHRMPAAIAGFTPASLLAAMYSVLRQKTEHQPMLDNCYPTVVRKGGNALAQSQLQQVMRVSDANWRGIGVIPGSGFELGEAFAAHDARRKYADLVKAGRHRAEMPSGCDCAQVVMGRLRPDGCKLFGAACTPRKPIGPCMVSDEGACRIWWDHGMRVPRTA